MKIIMFALYTPWETLENLWFTLPQFTLHLYTINPWKLWEFQLLYDISCQIFRSVYSQVLLIHNASIL